MTWNSTRTAGIDTSKHQLDVAIAGEPDTFAVPNTAQGWAGLAYQLQQAGVGRVGIEAIGGYQAGVVAHLRAAGLRVVVLQPLQVKAFAAMRLQRAKSDRIDAALIAACTHLLDDAHKLPPDPRLDALAGQLTFLEQVEEDIARIKTRLEHVADPRLRRINAADIARLSKRRTRELARLLADLRAHPDLARRLDLVLSIPAVGERTAISLLVRMPELGQVSREQAAAIAGLAPFARQSGTCQGETHIGGGRTRLRRALYMPALAGATRWNPVLRALYQRLITRGKAPTSAIVACARKLLVMANAVVARGTPWQNRAAQPGPPYATTAFTVNVTIFMIAI